MDTGNYIIPLRPIPPAKFPPSYQIYWKVKDDLIGFWPEKAYRFESLSRKVFKLPIFIANSPATVEHVMSTRHDIYQRKSPFMIKALEPLLGDGLFVSDGETWKKHREIESHAFKPNFLKQYSRVMVECANEWRDHFEKNYKNKPFMMLNEMAGLTAEILSRTMFGDEMGRENSKLIVDGFTEYQSTIKQMDISIFLGLPEWFPRLPQKKLTIAKAKQIHKIVDAIIEKFIKIPGESDTLLSYLLKSYSSNSSESLTLQQIRNEAVVILMAGHETTANTLAWAFYLLSIDSRVRTKLSEELRTVIGNRTPTFDDVPNLHYTRAIIEETLRLYPPVPVLSRQAMDDDHIGDVAIKKGTIVLIIPWLLHRHESYWENPHHFIPERFTGEYSKRRDKYTYIPFSTGPRICLGMAFGLTEAILILATLSQRFTFSLAPGYIPDYECRLTLRPTKRLPMILSVNE